MHKLAEECMKWLHQTFFSSCSKKVWNQATCTITHSARSPAAHTSGNSASVLTGLSCHYLNVDNLSETAYPTLDSGRAPLAEQITRGVRQGLACETLPSVLQFLSPR